MRVKTKKRIWSKFGCSRIFFGFLCLLQYKIDYVAHDADPYISAGHDDVYAHCKIRGSLSFFFLLAFLSYFLCSFLTRSASIFPQSSSSSSSSTTTTTTTSGKFLPTRRTPGISTSDLLARLVSGYRHRAFDKKLAKMGMHALMAEGSDWDESRVGSRAESRAESPVFGGGRAEGG